jgi:peptidylprolyl isomerase
VTKNRSTFAALCIASVSLLAVASCSSGSSSSTSSAPAGGDYASSNCATIASPSPDATAPAGTPTNGVIVTGAAGAAPIVSIDAKATAPTALVSTDLIPGTGAEVKKGATVTANYCGVGLTSRMIFDSSWARGGQPISFPLDQVIKGWTDGLPGMKVGGRRLLIIPGDLAYGANPPPGSGIGPNEALVFVVDMTAAQ